MGLIALRDRLNLLQVAIACGTVMLGGGLDWPTLAVAMLLAIWAFVRPRSRPSPPAQRAWTVLVAVGLLVTVGRALFLQEFLDAGVDFLLLLVIQRLFNRHQSRNHFQLLLLGALLMIVGAVINTGINYPILLAAYLWVTAMTLMINHLTSEGERLGPIVAHDIDRETRQTIGVLWRSSGQVAMAAIGGALAVFLVFPRFGVGLFLRGPTTDRMQSGFSDDVRLGVFGRIKTDATVVMRIDPPRGRPRVERTTWYLRGSSFDRYEAGHWRRTDAAEKVPLKPFSYFRILAPEGKLLVQPPDGGLGRQRVPQPRPIEGFAASTDKLQTTITLEDIGIDLLFVPSEPLGVRLIPQGLFNTQRLAVQGGLNRQFEVIRPAGPIRYEVVSRIGRPTPSELAATGQPVVPPHLEPYLQRDPSLSPVISELARGLAPAQASRIQKVQAVLDHLRRFEYTVDLQPSARVRAGADPVEAFLLETREGHCEYFATAMAVLLRELQVPTRLVNGYYGAHWNDVGEFYAVRQADAHSWVEVHFGPLGWVTFDPTPPTGRTAGDDAALWPAGAELLDAVRNAYLQYVVDYDLRKQMALLQAMGLRDRGPRPQLRYAPWIFAVVAFAGLVWLLRKRHRRHRSSDPPETRLYRAALRSLARRGWIRKPHESPARFAARIEASGMPEAEAFGAFARLYERVRFGPGATSEQLQRLRTLLRAIHRAGKARRDRSDLHSAP